MIVNLPEVENASDEVSANVSAANVSPNATPTVSPNASPNASSNASDNVSVKDAQNASDDNESDNSSEYASASEEIPKQPKSAQERLRDLLDGLDTEAILRIMQGADNEDDLKKLQEREENMKFMKTTTELVVWSEKEKLIKKKYNARNSKKQVVEDDDDDEPVILNVIKTIIGKNAMQSTNFMINIVKEHKKADMKLKQTLIRVKKETEKETEKEKDADDAKSDFHFDFEYFGYNDDDIAAIEDVADDVSEEVEMAVEDNETDEEEEAQRKVKEATEKRKENRRKKLEAAARKDKEDELNLIAEAENEANEEEDEPKKEEKPKKEDHAIFVLNRLQSKIKDRVVGTSSWRQFVSSLVEEVRSALSISTPCTAIESSSSNYRSSFGDLLLSGTTMVSSTTEENLLRNANELYRLSTQNDLTSHDEFLDKFKLVFDGNVMKAHKSAVLGLYLLGVVLNNKIKEYILLSQSGPEGKAEVSQKFFPKVVNPDIKYTSIWARMKQTLEEKYHRSLDVFQFITDIAGKNAQRLLENFNYERVNLFGLVKLMPYQGKKATHTSLKDVAQYILKELESSTSLNAMEVIDIDDDLPEILTTVAGNLKDESEPLTFLFQYAPNLMASHYEVVFQAGFLNTVQSDLKTYGRCMEWPLDNFILT